MAQRTETMPNRLNTLLEKQLKADFAAIDNMLVIDYQGLDSEKMAKFRTELHEAKFTMEVVKNSIFGKAVKDLPAGAFFEDKKGQLGGTDPFKGPSALIYGGESVVDVARFTVDWLKRNKDTISLKAALMGTEVFPGSQVVELSKLPNRKELLGSMAATVQAPIQKLAATVQASYAQILWGMNALAEKLEGKSA